MNKMIKNVFLGSLLISFVSLAGCENTLNGFGRDMQQNGQKIEKSTSGSSATTKGTTGSYTANSSTVTTTTTNDNN